MVSEAYQQLFSKYFGIVFIGVFRTLPNISNGTFCKNSYGKKLYYPETLWIYDDFRAREQ